MANVKLDNGAEMALSQLQDTPLSPMEEALFKSWATANQIEKPDRPDDPTDYRGIYKMLGGKILPYGELERVTKNRANKSRLEKTLQDRMVQQEESKEDQMRQMQKEQRQDITHQQKMQQKQMELAKAPYEAENKQRDLQAKEIDLQKQHLSIGSQQLGNKAKELDIVKAMIEGPKNAAGQTGTTTYAPQTPGVDFGTA